ncbi:hypothetical protein MPL3356_80134 [Mesorhizobium plurifarium]|uniref:Uncharacterized protein n=1 Tax=Mesorhizobium plurifarium TaxID=69974 RepID=A0A090GBC1_MESPL|nr:hypothetical protein MPL3356_80134 [Mesorhizobium plurifarium]CDX54975.1 hypothetical protein MPL3365_20268 [Mesorhizobium plurifarium]
MRLAGRFRRSQRRLRAMAQRHERKHGRRHPHAARRGAAGGAPRRGVLAYADIQVRPVCERQVAALPVLTAIVATLQRWTFSPR